MEFEQLAKDYSKMIYSIIYSLGIYQNVDEYYQIGLIGLWEGSKQYDEEKGSFPPFIRTYIRWKLLNALKKETSRQLHILSLENWSRSNPKYVDRPFEKEQLLSHFHHLTDLQKRWVILRFYYGLTRREIAEMKQIPLRKVQSWGNLAMKKCLIRNRQVL